MLFVMSTTLTAAKILVWQQFPAMIVDGRAMIEAGKVEAGQKLVLTGYLNTSLTIFVVACVCVLVLWSIARWVAVWLGKQPPKPEGTA